MKMRKLATVRQVSKLEPIENADFIELVRFTDIGWQCITRKGDLHINDKVVFFEIDSFLPLKDKRFEFLTESSLRSMGDVLGYRLKTIKLRGTLSQGLCLPLTIFPEIPEDSDVGTDVTERLGVTIYEQPIPPRLQGVMRGNFPLYIRKTDEERIQNLPVYFEAFPHIEFEMTEKLDGTSITIYKMDGRVGVCSRNIDLEMGNKNNDNLYVSVAKETGIIKELEKDDYGNIAIQGELIGNGVQENHYKLLNRRIYIFKVWDIDKQIYLEPEERYQFYLKLVENGVNIDHIPVLGECKIFKEVTNMEDMLSYADGISMLNDEVIREGLVFKSIKGDLSFKVVSNKYLLKHSN